MRQLGVALVEKEAQPGVVKNRSANFAEIIRQNYAPILLGLIVLLAFFLRIYDVTGNPLGLNQDEAVNGVDAYSLSQTLRDHHGNFLPLIFESFEDWSSSLLSYLTVPFMLVLGLSEFSVRLPVVLIGTATVFLIYKYIRRLTHQINLALLAAFLLTIMPWHIIYSRWGHPSCVVPFFVLLLLYVNLRVAPTDTKLWKFGAIGFCGVLLASTYPTQKLFTPLLLGVFLLADFFTKVPFKAIIRKYLIMGLTFLVLTSPIYLTALLDPRTNTRFSFLSIFGHYQDPLVQILFRYVNYFNPFNIFDGSGTFLFLAGFYYLGIAGCVYRAIFKGSFFTLINRPHALILLGWWLTTPVAASLTIDLYSSMRTLHGYPLTIIFSVLGFAIVGDKLKTRFKELPKLEGVLYFTIITLSFYFLVFFYGVYFGTYRESSKKAFQYGIAQFSEFLVQHKTEFDNVTVDSHINQPYIYYLFYSKEDPHQYNYAEITFLKNGQDNIQGIPKLDNYIFAKVAPETIAGATELFSVKDENGVAWYKVYAKDRQWYVQIQYDNGYDPPY